MKKSNKILLALATLWPFFYMILFFVFVFSSVLFMPSQGEASGPPLPFLIFFAIHFFTMIWILALTVFYMVNVFRNDRVDKDKKVLWAVVIFLGNMIAMPIYWYLYIWKDAPAGTLPSQPSLGSANTSAWTNDARAVNPGQYVPPSEPPNWR